MSALKFRSRAALALFLALAVAPLSAACGSSSDSSASSGTPAASGTRSVTDVEGTVMDVPVTPQRVVALSEPTLDGAIALGVPLVGTITGRGQSTVPNYLADAAGELDLLGGVANPNYEAIAKAKPDLILVDGTSINNNPDAIEILRKIAPTFYTGYAGGDWKANFTLVGQALNQADEAAAVMAAYDAKVTQTKATLGSTYASKTFSVVRWQGGSASVILKELPAGQALSDLGLSRPTAQNKRGRGHSEPISLENLDQIDADYLFFGTLGGSSNGNPNAGGSSDASGAATALAEAEKVPGFSALTAVREKHVITVDGSLWTSTGGPLLMQGLVDNVKEALG